VERTPQLEPISNQLIASKLTEWIDPKTQMINVILLMVSELSTSGVMVLLYRKETTSLWLVQESAKII
jgi:hypothetical protein